MPSPSVTHTFANATATDATQVNTNFTDLINGASDGTKDYSINALTVGGAATFNGNTTIGNSSVDDITFTGSMASHLPIKTTATYDIGAATLGIRSIYFGANSQGVNITGSASMSATWTLTLPVSAGTSRFRLETSGAGVSSWQPVRRSSSDAHNLGLTAAVAASALTVALKGADGNDPSATNPVDIVFQSATVTSGAPVTRTVTSAISVVVSSGSTLGHTSAVANFIYVWAIDNDGTVEIAVSTGAHDDTALFTTTAEGGGGAADSLSVVYSTTARANVRAKLIGRITSNQTTAGTWDTAVSTLIAGNLSRANERVNVNYGMASAPAAIVSATDTLIKYDTKVFDSHSAYSTATGLFTAPFNMVVCAGINQLWGAAAWTGGNDVHFKLFVDGAEYTRIAQNFVGSTITTNIATVGANTVKLNAGQTLGFYANQNSGSNKTLQGSVSLSYMYIEQIA